MRSEPYRILLVDDEKSLRDPLAKYLTNNYDFHVDSAASSDAAWQFIITADTPYDVVLIDDMLVRCQNNAEEEPEPAGIELMTQIKHFSAETECIIFTGWGMERGVDALKAGAYRYLAKPVNPDELAITIQTAAEHRRLRHQLETTQQEKEWLQTFLRINRAITSILEFEQALEEVQRQVNRLMDTACIDIVLFEKHQQLLSFELSFNRGQKQAKRQRPFAPGQGLIDWVVATGQPLLIKDFPHDPLPVPAHELHNGDRPATKSWLSVPIYGRQEVLGAIVVQSYEPHQYDETHQQILSAIAGQVAIAAENARLFARLQAERENYKALTASSFDAIVAIDMNKRITVFNAEAEKLFGWTAEEILGQKPAQLYLNRAKGREIFDLLVREESISNWYVDFKHRDGTMIPALFSAALIRDSNGQPIGQAGFVRDLRHVNLLQERQQALLRVIQAVTSTLALDEVLNLIVHSAVAAFPTALNGGLHLHDAVTNTLFIKADSFGLSRSAIEAASLKPGEGIAGWVYQKGQPLVLDNATQDPRYKKIDHPEFFDFQSMICVPLRVKGQVFGTLCLTNRQSPHAFLPEDLTLLSAFADQAATAIANARLYEESKRRQRLLVALDEASRTIRAEKETDKLMPEVVRLAVELVGCDAGGLFINWPHLKELDLQVVYNLPQELLGNKFPHGQTLVGRVAESGKTEIEEDDGSPGDEDTLARFAFKIVVGVPLRFAGNVEAVLMVASHNARHSFSEADREVLERFTAQASLALQTSRLLSREQRMYRQLAILHKISDYIEAARDLNKILHVVLTGITAGYGLCFNRAALLLLDEKREYLVGKMGIGHLELKRAYEDWAHHHDRGLEDFDRYLEVLEENGLLLTPVGERIQALRLPLARPEDDVFAHVVQEGKHVRLTPEDLSKLPDSFVQAFEPDWPLIVVPLLTRHETIGILVADNKFTKTPITSEDLESLLTFCNTAAIAIANVQLFKTAEMAQERLRSFFVGSNALVLSQDPAQILQEIVEGARVAAQATGVSMILIDSMAQVQDIITAGIEKPNNVTDLIRPNGLSMAVMNTGQYQVVEDANRHPEHTNPSPFWRDLMAGLCLPVSVEGKRIGVVWFHYQQPRHFTGSEIEASQFYVNQAAIAYDSTRRMRELKHMHQAAQALAGAESLAAVLEQIVHSAQAVLKADSAFIWSYDLIRRQFDLAHSVAAGIPARVWKQFQKAGPRPGGTADTVMDHGWIGVKNIKKTELYPFIGSRTRQLLNKIGAQSFQGLSLIVDDHSLGVLYVNYNRPRSFTGEERHTAKTFANLAALALKRARLFDQVTKARNAARVVARVTALEHLNNTLHSVINGTVEVTGCNAVTLYVYNPEQDKLNYPPATVGLKFPERVFRFPKVAADSIILYMLRREKPYIVEDSTVDPLFRNRRFTQEEQIASCVAVPLKAGNVKVGVMFVNYRQPHHFIEDELDNIELFSHQAAVAIRNAQLFEQVRRRVNALATLYETGLAVTGSLELDELLSQIAQQAWKLLHIDSRKAQYSVLALLDNSILHFRAAYPKIYLSKLQETVGHIDLRRDDPIGIVGRTVTTGQTQLVTDVTKDPDYINQDPQTLSQLAVPIKLGDEIIGVISVEHAERFVFDEEHQRALELLAAQAGVAIQNARLFKTVERRAEQFRTLYQANLKLKAELTVESVLHEVVNHARQLTRTQYGAMALLDEEGNIGHFVTSGLNDDAAARIATLPNNHGLLGLLLREPKTIRLDDIHQHPNFNGFPAHHPQMKSFLGVPILVKGKFAGSLYMANKLGASAFTQDDQDMLELLGLQAAIAIDNAQLFEQTQRRAQLLDMAARVARDATATLEIEELLSSTARLIAEYFRFYHVGVFLLDDTHEYTILQASHPKTGHGMLRRGHKLKVGQEGIIGHVSNTGRHHIALNVTKDQYHLYNPELPDTRSEIVFPLRARSLVIGALDLQSKDKLGLAEEDIATLQLLADQLGNAIQNAQLYQQVNERLEETNALREVAVALTGASEPEEIFEIVVKAARKLTGTEESSILFWDAQTEQFTSALRTEVDGSVRPYETRARPRGGRTRRIIDARKPIPVPDARHEPDFNRNFIEKGHRASLGVPLLNKDDVIGVLYVRSNQPQYFTKREIELFEALAGQAAVAVDRARHQKELERTKDVAAARTIVAWIGMVSATWRHAIEGHALTIKEEVNHLLNHSSQEAPHEVKSRLKKIRRLAQQIVDKPITPPLSEEEGVESVPINQLLQERIEQLWENDPYHSVQYQLDLMLDSSATVRASPEWLRRAFDVLVDNAVEAMTGIAVPCLVISTHAVGQNIEIAFTDNGVGMPEEVKNQLFRRQITKPRGVKGLGIGLMKAQVIVQTYSGEIRLAATGSNGTCMIILLPIETAEANET